MQGYSVNYTSIILESDSIMFLKYQLTYQNQ
jgi:hypothetical protein